MTHSCVGRQNRQYAVLLGACAIVLQIGCSAKYVAAPTPTSDLVGLQIHYGNPHQYVNPGPFTVSFRAFSIDSEGVMADVTAQSSWASSDSTIVTVTNSQARGIGNRNGQADVVVTYQGLSATARVVVMVQRPSIEIRPSESLLWIGTVARATARFSGNFRELTPDEVVWASSDTSVFTVERGLLTARAPGTAALTAAVSGTTYTSYLSVQPGRRPW
jgi:hypothetical protein